MMIAPTQAYSHVEGSHYYCLSEYANGETCSMISGNPHLIYTNCLVQE